MKTEINHCVICYNESIALTEFGYICLEHMKTILNFYNNNKEVRNGIRGGFTNENRKSNQKRS